MLHKRLTILSDNRTKDPERFQTEHGLAVLYEAGDYTLLLDTGASDLLIRNARELDIDLGDVDVVFLSHGHSDHIGGLEAFLNHNYVARIIVSPDAINSEFFSQRSHLHSKMHAPGAPNSSHRARNSLPVPIRALKRVAVST